MESSTGHGSCVAAATSALVCLVFIGCVSIAIFLHMVPPQRANERGAFSRHWEHPDAVTNVDTGADYTVFFCIYAYTQHMVEYGCTWLYQSCKQ